MVEPGKLGKFPWDETVVEISELMNYCVSEGTLTKSDADEVGAMFAIEPLNVKFVVAYSL